LEAPPESPATATGLAPLSAAASSFLIRDGGEAGRVPDGLTCVTFDEGSIYTLVSPAAPSRPPAATRSAVVAAVVVAVKPPLLRQLREGS